MNEDFGKKASVVIPTHAREDYLREAIDAALAQSHKPHEIIAVSDVKREETQCLIRDYANGDIPVRLIEWEPVDEIPTSMRAPISRNHGIYGTTGDLVAMIDDDDTWDPEYLEKVIGWMEEKKADVVVTHVYTNREDHSGGKRFDGDWSRHRLLTRNPGILGSNVVFRRQKLIEIGGYDPLVLGSADKEIVIRLCNAGGRAETLHEPLVYYRLHSGQNSRGQAKRRVLNRRALAKSYSQRMAPWTWCRLWLNILYWEYKAARGG